MKKNIGIVLKNHFPTNKTISILDKDLGKIRCRIKKKNISVGSIISYTIVSKKIWCLLDGVEVLYIPFETAIDDILFLHHILEMCYYFIPAESKNTEAFKLISYLYYFGYKIKYIIDKKLFLFKLFLFLGLYCEGKRFQTPRFHTLAIKSIDTLIDKQLHLKIEKDLDMWLYACVSTHPMFRSLKTIDFLYKNRCP